MSSHLIQPVREERNPKLPADPMNYLRRYKIISIDKYLKLVEPNESSLSEDLKYLAFYSAKIGLDLNLAKNGSTKLVHNSSCPELDLKKIRALVKKYDISWLDYGEAADWQSNKSLYRVALSQLQIFIDQAANVSPLVIDVRRFWYCANNAEFWAKNSNHFAVRVVAGPLIPRYKCIASRILCDLLEVLLTPDEPKLITVCALRATIKQEGAPIHINTYSTFKNRIVTAIREDEWGRSNPETKQVLRSRYEIAEIETELEPIKINAFIYWWNLTNLQEP